MMLTALFGCGASGGDRFLPAAEPAPSSPTPPAAGLPAISGGTLLITKDDTTAVAADPDRDSVWLLDLTSRKVRARVRLAAGAEPGRVLEDSDGRIHIALRRSGQLATIDPHSGTLRALRSVCPAPRGLAYDPTSDSLHVACAGGELVTLPASGGEASRRLYLDSDLRDVVMRGDHLLISRFRSAELLEVDAGGSLLGRVKPRSITGAVPDPQGKAVTASPTTAWRLAALPTGETLMLHQQALDSAVSTKPGGYGNGPCKGSGIVTPGVTLFQGASAGAASIGGGLTVALMPLAVDLAVSRDGRSLALIGPGRTDPASIAMGTALFDRSALSATSPCLFTQQPPGAVPATLEPIAGAFDGRGRLWLQSREPAQILLSSPMPGEGPIDFAGAEDAHDLGHALFHTATRGLIACASCHAEGGDDGHVWTFDPIGPRRTQSLRGGILATAPFHWDGDMSDLSTLMSAVFTGRMGGAPLSLERVNALGRWLDAQEVLPRSTPADPAAVERGKALFDDSVVGCASCHSGQHFTSNQSADVGTGQAFQVPPLLGLAARGPYLHSGCASTLRDRFDPACGGGDRHGRTSQLSAAQLDDLVAYLMTL